MEHSDLMQLADAYANTSFEQGLNQRTEDPAPELAREKLRTAINAELQRAVEAERERCSAATDKLQQVWEETRQQRDDLLAHIAGKGPLPAWADAWLKA